MAHGEGDPVRVVRAALMANAGIALCKFTAALLSGSASTLAEAVHSLADTGNQGLLFVGMRLAQKRADEVFAFGRAPERYFWPFLVAILLFSVGGAFALYEGVHRLLHPVHELAGPLWSWHGPLSSIVVLGVSALLESYSAYVALGEFRRGARGKPLGVALFGGKDPTIPLVLLEDTTALVGLSVALAAVLLTRWTGDARWDAAGSIVIGLLLMVVAVFIARDTHALLIGERASPEAERRAQELTEATPGVRAVTQLLTMHRGPDSVVLAMKVAFEPGTPVEQVEAVINAVEARIRAALPEMKTIFIEPDSRGDGRGVAARAASVERAGSAAPRAV